jgi:hypothetical protein
VKSAKAAREVTSDGLELVRSTPRTRLWVRPDHHIGRYDDILIAGIGFAYGSDQDRLEQDQEAELGEMLEAAIVGITEAGPVGLTEAPGPCVVSIQLGLKDILLHIAETSGSSVSYVSSFGSATMVVEFRDSTTEVPLLRYAANRGLGGGAGTGQGGANMGLLGRALAEMVTETPDDRARYHRTPRNGVQRWHLQADGARLGPGLGPSRSLHRARRVSLPPQTGSSTTTGIVRSPAVSWYWV